MGKLRPKTNYITLNYTRFGAHPFHVLFFPLSECETDISIWIALVEQAVGLITHQMFHYGNSLVVQWLGFKAWVPFLVWEVTSCKSHGTAKKKRKSSMQVCAYFIPELGSSIACMLSRFSHVRLSVTPWTVAHQAPLFMGFSRQEYWSGCHFLLQGIFLTQGLNLCLSQLLYWQADLLPLSHLGSP